MTRKTIFAAMGIGVAVGYLACTERGRRIPPRIWQIATGSFSRLGAVALSGWNNLGGLLQTRVHDAFEEEIPQQQRLPELVHIEHIRQSL